jgi:hypothetical protein
VENVAGDLEQIYEVLARGLRLWFSHAAGTAVALALRAHGSFVGGSQSSCDAMNQFAVLWLTAALTSVIARRSHDQTAAEASSSAARNAQDLAVSSW